VNYDKYTTRADGTGPESPDPAGSGLGSYTYIGGGITAAWSAAIDYFNR